MPKYHKPPINLSPKFLFGQQVIVSNEFYGTLTGTVEDVVEQESGFLFWKKRKLIYQVTGETDTVIITMFLDENELKPYQKLKPVK
jgi:hypothetical protein